MPEISVIVPVYNVEAYLPQCIDSILAQTFTDFELILVDDGSPDNCPVICDAYAQKDSRVRVIHQKNGGVSVARNAALNWMFANSDSTWVSFIDSDDVVHPKYLEYLHRAVIDNQTGISACDFTEFEEDQVCLFPQEEYHAVCKSSVSYLAKKKRIYEVCGNLYARDCFKQHRFPVGKLYEDTYIAPKMLYEEGKIAKIEAPALYGYRQRSGSTMHSVSLKMVDRIEAHEELCRYFQDKEKELYHNQLRKLAGASRTVLSDLERVPEYAKEVKRVRRRYARNLRRAAREGRVSFEKDKWLYEGAYPRLMNLYWLALAGKNKILRIFHK